MLRTAIRGAEGLADATVEASSIRGSRFTSLEVVDLRVRSGDSLLVAVDTLRIRHRFAPLLRRSLVVLDLALVAPSLDLRGCFDGFSSGESESGPGSAWKIVVGRGTLRGGSMRRGGCDPEVEPWSVARLDLAVRDVSVDQELAGRVDSLRVAFRPPGAPDGYRADLALSLELREGRLSVPSVTLDSPGSRVSGGGVLRLAPDLSEVADIDFELVAAPVALGDVAPFVPGLASEGQATLEAALTGSSRLLEVRAEMELSDGGSVTLESTFTPSEASEVRYRGALRSRDFDVSWVLEAAPAGAVDAEIDFDLGGPTQRDLAGQVGFSARRRDPSGAASVATVNALFSEGRAEIEGSVEVAGARASFEGSSRPFAQRPELSLKGSFGWDGPVPSDAPETHLGGTFDVSLAGSALASVSGQGGFDVRSSFVNRGTIPEATLDWTLEEGVGEWRLSGLVGSGSFSGTGGIDLRDGTVVRVASGVLRDLDVAAILGDSTGSGLNGTLVGIGKVASGEPVGFAGRLELGRSWYGVFEADSAAVGIDLRDERLEADVRVRLLGGSAELTVEAALDDAWSAKVTRGRFRGLDLGALRPSEPFSTELGGSWTGEVAPQGDGLAGRLAVNFGPSRINRLVVDTASVEATLREGALTYLGMVSYPAGEFHVEGEGRPLDSLPVWRISASRFADLDVAALLDLSGPAVRLSGDLETWVQGADRPGLAGEVALVIGPSQIGGWALRSATLGGRIGEGRFEGMAEAEVEGAEAVLDGTLDFGSSVLRYGGRGSFSVTDLERASQLEGMTGALAGTFDFDGYGVGVDSVRASGAVRLAAGTIRGMSVDSAKAVGRAESGRAVFDTLAVWSPDLAVRGEGALALLPDAQVASDLKILATVRGPEPLRALLGLPEVGLAEGVIEVSVTGPADGLEIYGKAAGTGLSYSTARFARFEATAEASLDDRRRLVHLDSRASADSLRWGNLSTEGVRLSVASEGEGYDVSVDAVVDADRRARLVAAVGVDGAGTDVRFMEISFEAGEESWALDRIAHVRIEDGVRVTDFRLSSASGRVVVDGSLNPMGELSLEAAAEGVRFGAFAELMGYGAYSGALDASVAVTGSASSPIVAGDLSGEVAFRGAPPQRLTAEILYEDLHPTPQLAPLPTTGPRSATARSLLLESAQA